LLPTLFGELQEGLAKPHNQDLRPVDDLVSTCGGRTGLAASVALDWPGRDIVDQVRQVVAEVQAACWIVAIWIADKHV
jgi:hypothetical protein